MKLGLMFENHIKNNSGKYILLLTFFILGTGFGAFTVNGLSSIQRYELDNYMQGFFEMLDSQTIDCAGLLRTSLIYNGKMALIIWLLGAAVIGIPFIFAVAGIRGFINGFTAGYFVRLMGIKGILLIASVILLKEIIIVPSLLAMGVNGVNFSQNIIKRKKSFPGKESFLTSFAAYCAAAVLCGGVLTVGVLVEAYIVPVLIRIITPVLN